MLRNVNGAIAEEVLSSLELPAGPLFRAAGKALHAYYRLVPTFPRLLSELLEGAESVLDLGCGKRSPLRMVHGVERTVGVDLFPPYLFESKKQGIHEEYLRADILSLRLKPRTFDAVISLSVLEHLTKAQGRRLIRRMEDWARRRVILYTSNGFREQAPYDENPRQEHVSGWTAAEFARLGYRVYGVGGWQRILVLRQVRSALPEPLWNLLCSLSALTVAGSPKASIDLCCVKDLT